MFSKGTYRSSAEKVVAVEENRGLTRCGGSLRLVEFYDNFVAGECCYGRFARLFRVAQTYACPERLCGKLAREVAAAVSVDARAVKICFPTESDFSALGIYMADVKRRGRGNSEALALTDGVCADALVLAEYLAIGINEIAEHGRLLRSSCNEIRAGDILDEADILAVGR